MKTPKSLPTSNQSFLQEQFQPYLGQYVNEGKELIANADKGVNALSTDAYNQAQGIMPTVANGSYLGLNQLNSTIAGDYMSPDSNPYIGSVLDTMNKKTTDAYQGAVNNNELAAVRGGIFGGSAYQDMNNKANVALADSLNQNADKTYMANYNTERANQLNTAGNIGAASSGIFGAMDAGGNIGKDYQALQGASDQEKLAILQQMLTTGQALGKTEGQAANPNYMSVGQQLFGLAGMAIGKK